MKEHARKLWSFDFPRLSKKPVESSFVALISTYTTLDRFIILYDQILGFEKIIIKYLFSHPCSCKTLAYTELPLFNQLAKHIEKGL